MQPLFRERVAHSHVIQFQHNFTQGIIIGSIAEAFCQFHKRSLSFFVTGFQHILQHILSEQLHFPFISHPKSGIQVNVSEIVANHKGTEAVNGCDLGIMNQSSLTLQMFVAGVLLQPLGYCLCHLLFHLCCCRFGKCHYQQFIYIHRVLCVQNQLNNALYQNRGFTGACCRRNKNILSSLVNTGLLGRREPDLSIFLRFHFRRYSFLFCFFLPDHFRLFSFLFYYFLCCYFLCSLVFFHSQLFYSIH